MGESLSALQVNEMLVLFKMLNCGDPEDSVEAFYKKMTRSAALAR